MTEPTEPICLFTFKEVPFKWQAGKNGEEPFYYSCCECGSEDLHWVLVHGTKFDFLKVIVQKLPNGFFKVAAFCKDHKPA